MRIKIIGNKPPFENCSDISNLIGKEFNADKLDNNSVYIIELDLIIFEDEYEIL